jgi:hypothetical protein
MRAEAGTSFAPDAPFEFWAAGRSAAGRFAVPFGRRALRALRGGLCEGRLEELTPELPDPADRVRRCPKGDDPRPRRCFDDGRGLRLRDTFWMNTDHPMVDTTFLDHQRTDLGIALEPSCGRDLQPAYRDYVAADEAGDRHPNGADVRLDVGLGADQQVAVTFDLTAEIAKDLATALHLELPGKDVVPCQDRRFWLEPVWLRATVRTGNLDCLHNRFGHVAPP